MSMGRFARSTDPAVIKAVCTIVGNLLPDYNDGPQNHNLRSALEKEEGSCFARMKLGGVALSTLQAGENWYHALCRGLESQPYHGFLVCNSPEAVFGALDSCYITGLNPVLNEGLTIISANEWWNSIPLEEGEEVEIKNHNVYKTTPVSEIVYPKYAIDRVIDEALKIGIPVPGVSG
jgi:hypothetical protein